MRSPKLLRPGTLFAALLLQGCDAPDTVLARHGCSTCHSPTLEGVGPSLRRISAHYPSKEALVQFLEGKAPPRVMPESFAAMKPLVDQTQALSPEERARLAEAILRHRGAGD